MRRLLSCLLVAVALPLACAALAQSDGRPPARVMTLLEQGRIEEAERALRDLLAGNAADLAARVMLGRVLDYDGRPDEAVQVWQQALQGDVRDFPIWMHIGALRARQGREGPAVVHRRGTVTYQPDRDPAGAEHFKRERLALAREAFGKAAALAPERLEPQLELARLHGALQDREAAVAAWRALAAGEPRNAGYALAYGKALNEAGRREEAVSALEAALERDPRLSEAHALLAAHYRAAGRSAEAWQSRQKAEFYGKLPPFTQLRYSPQTAEALGRLHERESVARLADDPSGEAAQLLAVIAWRHPHDSLEAMAFESLERRGAAAIGVVRELLEHARSTCTIRASAGILARQKDPGLFEKIVGALPGDLRSAGFEMDIAGALDALGDPRAVPALVRVLDAGNRSEEKRDSMIYDRSQARARAALALGGFDAPAAKEALAEGLEHPMLAPYAAAALYRRTGDPRYVPALREVAAGTDRYALYVLSAYLRRVTAPEALQLAADLDRRLRDLRQWPQGN